MLRNVKKMVLAVAAGLLAFGATGSAKADIIVNLPSTATTPFASGLQTFSYNASLTNDERLQPGNYFTIYDIPGLFTASGPAGWSASASALGVTPPLVSPTDNPALLNVTFTYTGTATGAGPADLGTFSVVTDAAHAGTSPGQFTAEATKAIGGSAGTPVDNIGSLLVPGAAPTGGGVPLPAAALLFPVGIAAAGKYYRRLRRQA